MLAVDTNVLVRLLTRDEERQVASAESFVEKGAWVSHLVLAETMWVLVAAYDLTHAQIVTAVEMLLDHKDLTVQDSDVVVLALGRFRLHTSVSFSDCLVLEIARKAGHAPLGTFDKALARLDGVQRL
jgi:predicted nucleic-acid-binding protein